MKPQRVEIPARQETQCPQCEKKLPERATNEAYPFCSARCQLVDLGRWLDEDYRIG